MSREYPYLCSPFREGGHRRKKPEKKLEKRFGGFEKGPYLCSPFRRGRFSGETPKKKLKKDLEVSKKVLTFAVRSLEGAVGIPKRI